MLSGARLKEEAALIEKVSTQLGLSKNSTANDSERSVKLPDREVLGNHC
jgi:hypothetical protein